MGQETQPHLKLYIAGAWPQGKDTSFYRGRDLEGEIKKLLKESPVG